MLADAESESFGSSAEELIVASLLATPAPLLKIFSHSNALKHVDVWLAKAAAAESHGHAMQLLALLAKMPMSIASLQVAQRAIMPPHLYLFLVDLSWALTLPTLESTAL